MDKELVQWTETMSCLCDPITWHRACDILCALQMLLEVKWLRGAGWVPGGKEEAGRGRMEKCWLQGGEW